MAAANIDEINSHVPRRLGDGLKAQSHMASILQSQHNGYAYDAKLVVDLVDDFMAKIATDRKASSTILGNFLQYLCVDDQILFHRKRCALCEEAAVRGVRCFRDSYMWPVREMDVTIRTSSASLTAVTVTALSSLITSPLSASTRTALTSTDPDEGTRYAACPAGI